LDKKKDREENRQKKLKRQSIEFVRVQGWGVKIIKRSMEGENASVRGPSKKKGE